MEEIYVDSMNNMFSKYDFLSLEEATIECENDQSGLMQDKAIALHNYLSAPDLLQPDLDKNEYQKKTSFWTISNRIYVLPEVL